MFDALSDRLGTVFDRLRGRGALSEQDVRDAMREVRIALLEADVALPVVRRFIDEVTEKAVGQNVLRSVTPGQQVVKIVNDAIVDMLGGEDVPGLDLNAAPPVVILMVGLQGSGKTTTTAKLGKLLKEKFGKKALMASLDVNRPAAQEQLKVLGEQASVATLPVVAGQQPVEIARRALESARLQNFDVLMLDTAGRLHVDEALMAEMKAVHAVANPREVLLVVDALMKANKDFDFLMVPNADHFLDSAPYYQRRRWDFFVRDLLDNDRAASGSQSATNSCLYVAKPGGGTYSLNPEQRCLAVGIDRGREIGAAVTFRF